MSNVIENLSALLAQEVAKSEALSKELAEVKEVLIAHMRNNHKLKAVKDAAAVFCYVRDKGQLSPKDAYDDLKQILLETEIEEVRYGSPSGAKGD